ncbi:MAG: NAD(P)-dependent oxidoreductase, partial [Synergistaceae bacterium]|nr:NAD(P)-dependent oxidoreductase [Synergistaceae bacterium]
MNAIIALSDIGGDECINLRGKIFASSLLHDKIMNDGAKFHIKEGFSLRKINLQGRNILITGAAGFIGAALSLRLINE